MEYFLVIDYGGINKCYKLTKEQTVKLQKNNLVEERMCDERSAIKTFYTLDVFSDQLNLADDLIESLLEEVK